MAEPLVAGVQSVRFVSLPGPARPGADVERTVLPRAVLWHCEDRLLHNRGTVVVF
ncbi:hypothetical protein ACIBJF_50610 [Streptomyces sp. NPDC050743]|uniref:hypothetical protein n=1 Tax=Streptomyces sp. NPDC050743 TaxID=3365634 RepID=UPI003796DD72